jgi:hypothetical protein
VLRTIAEADASVSNGSHSKSSESQKIVRSVHSEDAHCEDSAAGVFLSNSFVRGAVARGPSSLKNKSVFPVAFSHFFRCFWGQQQVLVEDGVQMPGHVAKFLPILEAGDAGVSFASMWSLAFDGGASAACTAAAAAISRAPFCSRYIEEVTRIPK